MISPARFFNAILGLLGGLQVFSAACVSTEGGPTYPIWSYPLHPYLRACRFFETGYASALAWSVFALVITPASIQVRWSNRWAYYEAAARGRGCGERSLLVRYRQT